MKDLILVIFSILKKIGRLFTVFRNIVFNLLFLSIIVVFAASFWFQPKGIKIKQNTILRLDIVGNIVDTRQEQSSFEKLLGENLLQNNRPPETSLQDLLDVIDEGCRDERITAMLLNLKYMGSSGLSQLLRLGKAFESFKTSGKTIICADDFYTQKQYFLASYSDQLIINPMGAVDLHGFGVYRLYFKDALDKLKINYNIFRVGTFKSALEPFLRNSMSEDDKEQNEVWLSALWQIFSEKIAVNRKITKDTIHNYTSNIHNALERTNGDTAQLALQNGLVDKIMTRQQIRSYLASLSGGISDKPNILSTEDYFTTLSPSYSSVDKGGDKIGLLIAEGAILPGENAPGMIGSKSLSESIRNAAKDDNLKALVLTINSGGGSAFASEIIRQELLEFKKSRKPFVVCMGNMAASGGYWIGADADEIWASEATLTGSIGVFGAIPTFENSLAELGIYSDGTGTTPLAAGLSLVQPLPIELQKSIQLSVEQNYQQFIKIVSEGRDMPSRQVEKLAQGRVYDGKNAQKIGLVDQLGSVEDAIIAAADLAGITDYEVEYVTKSVNFTDQFIGYFRSQSNLWDTLNIPQNTLLSKIQKSFVNQLQLLLSLDDPRGIYAHSLLQPL